MAHEIPPGSHIHFLLKALSCAPSADNSQPWCFNWDGRTLKVYAHSRGGFPLDYHATLLALGAAAENAEQALRVLGSAAGTLALKAPEDASPFIVAELNTPTATVSSPSTPIWEKRHTNRGPYAKEALPNIEKIVAASSINATRLNLLDATRLPQVAKWIQSASEIRFRTQEVHEWFGQSLRFKADEVSRSHGLHVSTLNLPPGGAALLRFTAPWQNMARLNRLGLYKMFAAIEAAGFKQAPYALAIVGPATAVGAFEGGRTLQRAWLAMTERAWAGHPFYVVSDTLYRYATGRLAPEFQGQAARLHEDVTSLVGTGNALHCLLRVGVAKRPVPRSGRLSLSELLCKPRERE